MIDKLSYSKILFGSNKTKFCTKRPQEDAKYGLNALYEVND